jgi:hypothetical protein
MTLETLRRAKAQRIPNLRDRANRALKYLASNLIAERWSSLPSASESELKARTYSGNSTELESLFHILAYEELIAVEGTMNNSIANVKISAKGLLAAEALSAQGSNSLQGFVGMSFDNNLREAWISGFDPAIRSAGYQPVRIDAKEYVGGITDEIMAEIRRSRFVVADYTGQKNGVYFEAGFALGLGLVVIPTCRADEIAGLHFDIRHLNTLTWNDPAELSDLLANRIRAVLGAGPQV